MITADITPQRHPNESREQYVARRRAGNEQIKRHLKGSVLWPGSRGTYVRDVDGPLRVS